MKVDSSHVLSKSARSCLHTSVHGQDVKSKGNAIVLGRAASEHLCLSRHGPVLGLDEPGWCIQERQDFQYY